MASFYLMYFGAALAVVTHVYRVWELVADIPNKFCINTPLFVFNDIKLLGLLIIAGALPILKLI